MGFRVLVGVTQDQLKVAESLTRLLNFQLGKEVNPCPIQSPEV